MNPHLCSVGLATCTPIPMVPGPAGPRLAMISTEWHRAEKGLALPTNFNRVHVMRDGMEVGEARQSAIEGCMSMPNRPEFIFFLDYDVIPQYDAITKLIYRARHYPDYDIFAGVYCLKTQISEPLIYKDWGLGPFWDWCIGDLLTEGITGVHMGCTLIRMSLFDRLDYKTKPAFLTENEHFVKDGCLHSNRGTEDLYFCKRAVEEAGAKILVDTSVLCGHQDFSTGQIYGLPKDSYPAKKARWHVAHPDAKEYEARLKAIDLGAGEHKREWPGYESFSTDIRPGIGVDYVQDTRFLNLPYDHFDLVASSHHLEHFARSEQQEVWKQIFLITKPGGKIEHVVPSLEWAAAKIAAGEMDEHVLNVLYGAQESHGYARELNTHYFGYTKALATALAEAAGFVDVKCEDWTDTPDLRYNLIITGNKPGPIQAEEVPAEEATEAAPPAA